MNCKATFNQYLSQYTKLSYEEVYEKIKHKITEDLKPIDVLKLFYYEVTKKK